MGSPVIHVGPLGKASVIKVITNMLAFVHVVALGEALMLAKQGGIPLETAYEVIRASSATRSCTRPRARSSSTAPTTSASRWTWPPRIWASRSPWVASTACRSSSPALVEQTFMRAREQYGGSAWSSQVVKLLEDELGVDLRAPGFPPRLEGTPPAPEA